MPESQHTIAGTVLTMPIRVHKADVHSAMFTVDADAAQRLIDYSGLRVFELRPGRAVVNLLLTRFFDCDLGQYNEFSFCVMVQPPGSDVRGLRAFGDAAAPSCTGWLSTALHAGGGQTDLGLPEDHGGLHRSRRQPIRVRRQRRRVACRRDGDRPRAAECRCRRVRSRCSPTPASMARPVRPLPNS